jgi:hypothetical protein
MYFWLGRSAEFLLPSLKASRLIWLGLKCPCAWIVKAVHPMCRPKGNPFTMAADSANAPSELAPANLGFFVMICRRKRPPTPVETHEIDQITCGVGNTPDELCPASCLLQFGLSESRLGITS